MVPEKPEQPRKLVWLVDSLDRLTSFPPAVRHKLGFALYQAQIGQKHESAKTLRGFEATVAGAGRRSERDIPRGLCGPIPASRLRAACFSKEGEVGHCDSEARSRSDPAAAPACAQDGRKVKETEDGQSRIYGEQWKRIRGPEPSRGDRKSTR